MKERYLSHKLAASLAALGTATVGPSLAQADEPEGPVAHGAIEVMAGQDSGTLDAKVLVFDGDLTVLSRNRVTETYQEGSVGSFSVNSVTYGLGEGLAAFGEVDAAPGAGLMPRAGMQHFYAGNGFSVFNLLSIPMDGRDLDVLHIGKVTYLVPLGEDAGLAAAAETLTSVNGEGLGFATQRLRLGAQSGNYQIGAAADLSETSAGDPSANVGVYGSVAF